MQERKVIYIFLDLRMDRFPAEFYFGAESLEGQVI